MRALKDAEPARVPHFSPPSWEADADAWPAEAAEVLKTTANGIDRGRCPKCMRQKPSGEISLWPDPEQGYRPRFLCSGCRSTINRRDDTLYKDDMLVVLQQYDVPVPEKLIQWMRVQCKIAAHPGSPTTRLEAALEVADGGPRAVIRKVAGGRTGVRSTIGVVD